MSAVGQINSKAARLVSKTTDPVDSGVLNAIFEILASILKLPDSASQGCALHGLVSLLLRPGPLRSFDLTHLDIDSLHHLTGGRLDGPGGSGAWRHPSDRRSRQNCHVFRTSLITSKSRSAVSASSLSRGACAKPDRADRRNNWCRKTSLYSRALPRPRG